MRAAISSSRALGQAVHSGGGMSSEIFFHLQGQQPYRLALEEQGETRTCLATGEKTLEFKQEDRPAPVQEGEEDA